MDVVWGAKVYACRMTYQSSVCSVGGGHGVSDSDTISAKPRKRITSNSVLATAGPGEQEEARPLSNGSCCSAVLSRDPRRQISQTLRGRWWNGPQLEFRWSDRQLCEWAVSTCHPIIIWGEKEKKSLHDKTFVQLMFDPLKGRLDIMQEWSVCHQLTLQSASLTSRLRLKLMYCEILRISCA